MSILNASTLENQVGGKASSVCKRLWAVSRHPVRLTGEHVPSDQAIAAEMLVGNLASETLIADNGPFRRFRAVRYRAVDPSRVRQESGLIVRSLSLADATDEEEHGCDSIRL